MQQFGYNTGRDYGIPQILVIDVPDLLPEDMFDQVTVLFDDEARNIAGAVKLMPIEFMSTGNFSYSALGAAVLREYDAGRYDYIEF